MYKDNIPPSPYLPTIKDLGHTAINVPAGTILEWVRAYFTLRAAAYGTAAELPEVQIEINGRYWHFTDVVVDGWHLAEEFVDGPPLQYLLLPGIEVHAYLQRTEGQVPHLAYAAIDPVHCHSGRMRRGLEVYTATLLQQQIPD